jgi:hypothetical protein
MSETFKPLKSFHQIRSQSMQHKASTPRSFLVYLKSQPLISWMSLLKKEEETQHLIMKSRRDLI